MITVPEKINQQLLLTFKKCQKNMYEKPLVLINSF